MVMTDKEIQNLPCEMCGGPCRTLSVGYSCPIWFSLQCSQCGRKFERNGAEGIKVMTVTESVSLRPHLYIDSEDPILKAIALDAMKKLNNPPL
jgi:hypothetical protein